MRSKRRIALLLTLVFLLPALFFSVYELSSLNEDEQVIQEIHYRQLESILFSVNQYSDDIVGSWISKIENGLEHTTTPDSLPKKIYDVLVLNSSLKGIFISDTIDGKPMMQIYSVDLKEGNAIWKIVKSALEKNTTVIETLVSYKKNQFQKVERLELWQNDRSPMQCLLFATQIKFPEYRLAGLITDADLFIEDIVGPRLQGIATDQFVLSALQKKNDSIVYSTQVGDTTRVQTDGLTKDFWILPDYNLGIRTSGTTLEQLVRERTQMNLIVLIALNVILILGVILVFRNLKREVDLAQNKSDFVSNVSHEIRTPLSLISMFAETLEMGRVPSDEKKKEYYRIISQETQRLSGIVNKILSFSQTEAKKKTLFIDSLHLDTEIKEILKTYEFHLSNKGFEYTYAGNDEVWIKADREALTEAFINLVDNAMKYSENKKSIEIKAGIEAGFGYISVRDFGIGISQRDQKHIFDKFYRVSTGNLAKSRGTGLGLSLVKQLMEFHQGYVDVVSAPGKGSKFTLHFPLQKQP